MPEPTLAGDRITFTSLIDQFWAMLDALAELSETVTPHAASLEQEPRNHIGIPLSPERAERLKAALTDGGIHLEERTDDEDPRPEAASTATSEPAPEEEPTLTRRQADGQERKADDSAPVAHHDRQAVAKAFAEAFDNDPIALTEFAFALERATSAPPLHSTILNRALLTMTVGALETLIAGLARQHYALNPSALESQGKEFSLADLLVFTDLAEARDNAISRRVDELMRGGLEEWLKWFTARLGDTVGALAVDSAALVEVVQRRHVVVHNNGRVSQSYRTKTGSTALVDSELPIDRGYLDRAIDDLEVFGTRLAVLAWIKWKKPAKGVAAQFLNRRVFRLLEQGRWVVADALASTGCKLSAPDQLRQFLQVNQWQAAKRARGLEAIRNEIEHWDTSALSPPFAIAKAALLDDSARLAALIPEALERGDITERSLAEWPLFLEARAMNNWPEIVGTGSQTQASDAE